MSAEALSYESDQSEYMPRVHSASRELLEYGCLGMEPDDVRKIIKVIKGRKSVRSLVLGYNCLGDDGCRELFRFLCTEDGRRHEIMFIDLDRNDIGDNGLETITEYLVGNEHLKELHLRTNKIQGDEALALKFSSAINASSLEQLNLSENPELSDPFIITFLSHLDSPALRKMDMTTYWIASEWGSALVSFLTSQRSRALETFRCMNYFDRLTLRSLILGIRMSNFTLQNLEIYYDIPSEVDEVEGDTETADDRKTSVNHSLRRNKMLRRQTHREALLLLSYSRTLLHHHSQPAPHESSQNPESPGRSTRPESQTASMSPVPASFFPFHALPRELQQHVLAFLTPTLSTAKRYRAFRSAASPATLRTFFPRLGTESWLLAPPKKCNCKEECKSARLRRRRSVARKRWLKEAGCIRFEAEGRTEAEVLRLL